LLWGGNSFANKNQVLSVNADTAGSSGTWFLDPGTVDGQQPFELMARNTRYSCASEFSHKQVKVQEDAIFLSVTETLNPAVLCPAVVLPPEKAYGPTFKIPALKVGSYAVYLTEGPACLWTQPACEIAVQQEFVGTLKVRGEDNAPVFSISPTQVAAQAAFKLQLLSYNYTCATVYTHQAYRLSGDTLTLQFAATEPPDVACPAIYKPYGPVFSIRGLPAGKYQVFAEAGLECMYTDPRCLVGVLPQYAGTLSVGDTAGGKVDWFIRPRSVAQDTAFEMQLLSDAYGNCQSEFPNPLAALNGGNIDLTFDIVFHPDRICVTDVRPFGPRFKMPPLKAGKYPVRIWQNNCPPNVVCAVGPVLTVVDTLVVTAVRRELAIEASPQVGLPFSMKLLSDVIPCGVTLAKKQVAVVGTTIYLGFQVHADWAVDCAPGYAFEESFSVPGLTEGRYVVKLDPLDSCTLDNPLCNFKYQLEGVADLNVGAQGLSVRSVRRNRAVGAFKHLSPGAMQLILPDGRRAVNPLGQSLRPEY